MAGENLIPATTTTVATAAAIMLPPNTSSVTASSTEVNVIALPAVPMAPSSNANLAFTSASGVKDNKKVSTDEVVAPSPNADDVASARTSGVKNSKKATTTEVVLALPAFTGSAGPVTSSSNVRVKKNKKAPTEANLASSNVHVTSSASRSRVKNEKKAPAEVILALPAFTSPAAPVADPSTSKANVTSASTSGVKQDNKKPRGKIRMEKMDKESNLMVTFSKRKSGLIKKANELCTLCGVQCAVVVFSPAGKPFSFGHPSVDEVVNRYLMGNPNPIYAPQGNNYNQVVPQNAIVEANQPADGVIAENLSKELKDLAAIFEAAKKHGQVVDERRKARMADCWWERPVQELNVCQLGVLRQAMEDLKSKVYDHVARASSSGPSTLLGPSTNALSDGGFPRWNNNNNYGLDEAGPSGHAAGGRLCGSSSKRRE